MSTRGKLERGESEKKERRPEQILYRITDFENHETIGTGAFSRVRLVRRAPLVALLLRCVARDARPHASLRRRTRLLEHLQLSPRPWGRSFLSFLK